MCGIFCEIIYSNKSTSRDQQLLQRIKNRGPDGCDSIEIDIDNKITAFFYGSVLWMQGPRPTLQPIGNQGGILLYNGDIFDESWDISVSDTQLIMDKLSDASSVSSEKKVIEELRTFKGPFSLIYYNKLTHDLFFTRDRLGRNSLLMHRNKNSLIISSVLGRKYECAELPATHIYKLNIIKNTITLYPWLEGTMQEYSIENWLQNIEKQQSLSDEHFKCDLYPLTNLNDNDNLINYLEMNAQKFKCTLTLMSKLMTNDIINQTVYKITELLEKSVEIRIKRQPNKCRKCLYEVSQTCTHSAVGILFSGGLDCTILAFLADKYIPKEQSIDLINVAFKKECNASYNVPDRLTGRSSYEELKTLCQSRVWVFKEVNVSKEELEELQKTTIGDLVYPRQTILDESLGSALWFASSGKDNNSVSDCRVLLLGTGADELFGGYTRHKKTFLRNSWTGLCKELQLDWKRIAFRNLARDNRVICDHGRQPRMPYLDEDFTDYILKLQPWLRCYPSNSFGPGVGDKLMLRLVAFNLGLKKVVTLPKRALQFGSRIANKKDKGCDLSKNLMLYK